jgi:hypothetical protein
VARRSEQPLDILHLAAPCLKVPVTFTLALMSTFTASSTTEFLPHLQDHGLETMYRGQGYAAWPLVPSIARFAASLEGYDCIVPGACKRKLRRQLSVLGITHRSVYRGLEGTTRWIKSEISRFAA